MYVNKQQLCEWHPSELNCESSLWSPVHQHRISCVNPLVQNLLDTLTFWISGFCQVSCTHKCWAVVATWMSLFFFTRLLFLQPQTIAKTLFFTIHNLFSHSVVSKKRIYNNKSQKVGMLCKM